MLRAVVIAAALAGACRDPKLAELESIRKEVCACKTAACGDAAMKRVPQGDVRSDHQAQQIAKAMMRCLSELYARDRPSTDPDAEAPGSGGSAADSAGGAAPAASSAGSAAPAATGAP
jgi:hypothetical protein